MAATTLDVVQGKLEGAKARFSRERLADLADGVGSTVGAGDDLRKMVEMTDEQFVELGRKCARELDRSNKVVALPDPRAARLSALVSPHAAEDGFHVSVKLYENPMVNAFALPDGSLRVYTGLLDIATDDEIRAVIGHEIGHVVQHHTKSAAQVAMLGSAGAKAAISATSGGSRTGDALEVIATHIASLMMNAKYSRVQERRADDYAFAFVMAHGYSTEGLLTLFGKLGSKEEAKSPFATHPASGDRAARLRELVAKAASK
jgi:putative metalloprotease